MTVLGSSSAECQRLAEDVQRGEDAYRYLDVAQLLKHALGLANQLGSGFDLTYLYFDWHCPEAEVHRAEVARFVDRVGAETRFKSMSYQQLFQKLETQPLEDGYSDYLRARYFSAG